MPGEFLTVQSQIQCPHGGQAVLTTANSKVSAVSAFILLESDVHQVAGCSFTLPGPKPSPCVTIEWQAGAAKSTINGTKGLLKSSIGQCKSAEGAVQGTAIIVNTQMKVKGQ
jgi:hypothetical protein